ncbi:MAG: alpha/beta fold hydrolase [Pseudomonadota bacterium]
MKRVASGLKWALVTAFVGWCWALVALLLFRETLIYPFSENADYRRIGAVPGGELARLTAVDGTEIHAWLVPPKGDRPVIFFFMGNAGHLPANARRINVLAEQGFGIAALNYRGAGGSAGAPSQTHLTDDALVLYDRLDDLLGSKIPEGRRVSYGTSLGAALAAQLAVRRPVAAVVLAAPFARLCEVGEHHYPWAPICWILPDNRWETLDIAGEIAAPTLVVHGDADRVVPISQAEALFGALPDPKTFIRYPEGGHADLHLYGSGPDTIAWLHETLRSAE